jgi:hypothetical protein
MVGNGRIWIDVAIATGLTVGSAFALGSVRAETSAAIIAAQIRMQGYACEGPLGATKNRKISKPNAAIWTLRCKNATYRVHLVPDMGAKVTRIK